MKKNRMMRLASLLLVLVLMTSSVVGGTFAKYVSTASGSDTARVARWSFNVNDTDITTATTDLTIDLFNTISDDDAIPAGADDANVHDGVIAPGTGGKFDIVLTNTSEVKAKYGIVFAETSNSMDIPIQYSLNGNDWEDDAANINITASEDEANSTVLNYGESNTKTITVYWRWAFEGTTAGAHAGQSDDGDTFLGVKAQGTAPSVTFQATITATQVD